MGAEEMVENLTVKTLDLEERVTALIEEKQVMSAPLVLCLPLGVEEFLLILAFYLKVSSLYVYSEPTAHFLNLVMIK